MSEESNVKILAARLDGREIMSNETTSATRERVTRLIRETDDCEQCKDCPACDSAFAAYREFAEVRDGAS